MQEPAAFASVLESGRKPSPQEAAAATNLQGIHFLEQFLNPCDAPAEAFAFPSLDPLPQEKAKRDLSGYNLFCKAYREQKVRHQTITPTANLSRMLASALNVSLYPLHCHSVATMSGQNGVPGSLEAYERRREEEMAWRGQRRRQDPS